MGLAAVTHANHTGVAPHTRVATAAPQQFRSLTRGRHAVVSRAHGHQPGEGARMRTKPGEGALMHAKPGEGAFMRILKSSDSSVILSSARALLCHLVDTVTVPSRSSGGLEVLGSLCAIASTRLLIIRARRRTRISRPPYLPCQASVTLTKHKQQSLLRTSIAPGPSIALTFIVRWHVLSCGQQSQSTRQVKVR